MANKSIMRGALKRARRKFDKMDALHLVGTNDAKRQLKQAGDVWNKRIPDNVQGFWKDSEARKSRAKG